MEHTEERFFEHAVEVLETLVLALGAGLGTWGTVNLVEGYRRDAEFEQLTEEYRARIHEINVLMEQLYDDKAADRICDDCFDEQVAEYEAEQAELFEAIAELKADIAAQKKQGMAQLMAGGRLVLIGLIKDPETAQDALDYMDKKHRENGKMPD